MERKLKSLKTTLLWGLALLFLPAVSATDAKITLPIRLYDHCLVKEFKLQFAADASPEELKECMTQLIKRLKLDHASQKELLNCAIQGLNKILRQTQHHVPTDDAAPPVAEAKHLQALLTALKTMHKQVQRKKMLRIGLLLGVPVAIFAGLILHYLRGHAARYNLPRPLPRPEDQSHSSSSKEEQAAGATREETIKQLFTQLHSYEQDRWLRKGEGGQTTNVFFQSVLDENGKENQCAICLEPLLDLSQIAPTTQDLRKNIESLWQCSQCKNALHKKCQAQIEGVASKDYRFEFNVMQGRFMKRCGESKVCPFCRNVEVQHNVFKQCTPSEEAFCYRMPRQHGLN